MHGTTLVGLPAKEIHGVVSRHLGRIKALFLYLSIPIAAFEARNSAGIAGAPYGEHTPLKGRAREQGSGGELCADNLISTLSTRSGAAPRPRLLEQTRC